MDDEEKYSVLLDRGGSRYSKTIRNRVEDAGVVETDLCTRCVFSRWADHRKCVRVILMARMSLALAPSLGVRAMERT